MRSPFLWIAPALIALASCAPSPPPSAFCGIDNGRLEPVSMIIDVGNGMVRGTDTTSTIKIVESDLARGFVDPFPLTLPKLNPSVPVPDRWELEGTEFIVGAGIERNPDWILIHARRLNRESPEGIVYVSSVLYSRTEGVLAIRIPRESHGRILASEFFRCGTQQLHASSF